MANEFARNIKDAGFSMTRALTSADGSVTSSDFDLGSATFRPENYELAVEIPSLASSELNTADTLTVTVQHGAAATPTTSAGLVKVITGTGSTIAAQELRFRLPSNCSQYINVKFTTAGTTGDMSAKSATISLRF